MKTIRSQFVLVAILVTASVVFGMVIAGGTHITTPGFTATGPQVVTQPTGPTVFPNFADLAEAVLPAVASVRVITIERADSRSRGSSPFNFFSVPDGRDPATPRVPASSAVLRYRSVVLMGASIWWASCVRQGAWLKPRAR